MATRRESFGHKGLSRVTLYERPDATSLFIEWWDDEGRHREAISTILGYPVTDWDLGREVAKRMAKAQEAKRNEDAAEMLGLPPDKTLAELFAQRHEDLEAKWSPKYARSRERRRAFWLTELGNIRLTRVTPARVEAVALEAQKRRDLSDRWRQDVLRYIVDSFAYGEKKLKWIEPRHNLSAVDMPTPKGRLKAYTPTEAVKLIRALRDVHPVAHWYGVVALATGRRISSILAVGSEDVDYGSPSVIRFRPDDDKAGKPGEALVYGLPAREDWLPYSYDKAKDWLREAEEIAGVPHVSRRAWHGLKKAYATLTDGMTGSDLQSGTLPETLRKNYREETREPKDAVAQKVAEALGRG